MAARITQPNRPIVIRRWRIQAMLIVVLLVITRVIVQLGNLQIIRHDELSQGALDEMQRTVTLRPTRGVIRDAKGNVLALDVDRESLFVVPQDLAADDASKLALLLSGLLGKPAGDILQNLTNNKLVWVPIARWMKPEVSAQVEKIVKDYPALRLQTEPLRFYPQNNFAAQVIGAVNLEGEGISGVEGFYNTELKGITGTVKAEWDAQGNPIWSAPLETRPASDGEDLELTLDPLVQHVIETELKKAIDAHHAEGGSIVVIEPKTGAIRGMASYPSFDPNTYYNYKPEVYNINPAIGELYEPGSTFKIMTMATGLQTHSFTADTQVNDTGVIERYGYALGNWNRSGNGMLTPERVLYFSSNVGALQFNELTGPDKFYAMVEKLGYGQLTGVDMTGENTGIVKFPKLGNWSPLDLDTNAFGQGIAVTPLQQVRMVATIGNNGVMMKPYIVQKRCKNDVCEETKPQVVGQPFDPGVAWTVRKMLTHSANNYGSAVWGPLIGNYNDPWLVPGYEVSAKTGTSDVPDGEGGYSGIIGSVLGLAPTDDARYAILVKIDKPADDAFGVVTAIPVFQKVADQLLRYAHVPPNPALVSDGQTIGMASSP